MGEGQLPVRRMSEKSQDENSGKITGRALSLCSVPRGQGEGVKSRLGVEVAEIPGEGISRKTCALE